MKWITLSIIHICLSSNVQAEYRVYQYLIKSKNSLAQNHKTITSSLNPVAYLAYHGGNTAIDLEFIRTWICPGNTSNKIPHCQSPYEQLTSQGAEDE